MLEYIDDNMQIILVGEYLPQNYFEFDGAPLDVYT